MKRIVFIFLILCCYNVFCHEHDNEILIDRLNIESLDGDMIEIESLGAEIIKVDLNDNHSSDSGLEDFIRLYKEIRPESKGIITIKDTNETSTSSRSSCVHNYSKYIGSHTSSHTYEGYVCRIFVDIFSCVHCSALRMPTFHSLSICPD